MFGQRLRLLREKKGLRQSDVADALGVTRVAVTKWESDEREPDHETVRLLAELFGVTTDYLLGRSSNPQPDAPEAPTGLAPLIPIVQQIGRNILKARRAAKLSQPELARKANVNRYALVSWESGMTWPTEQELARLAAALSVSPEEIAPDGVPPTPQIDETMQIFLRSDGALTDQDIKEIMAFIEFTRMKRKREQEKE